VKNIPERARYVLISAVLSLILLGYACGRALELRNGAGVPWWEAATMFALTAAIVPVILHCVGEALDSRLQHRPGRHRAPVQRMVVHHPPTTQTMRTWPGPLGDFAMMPPPLWSDTPTDAERATAAQWCNETITDRALPVLWAVDPVLTEAATAIQNDRGKLPPELVSDNEDAIRYATHYIHSGRHHLRDEDTQPHLFTNTDADLYGGYDRG
jgi:hypothetical protein